VYIYDKRGLEVHCLKVGRRWGCLSWTCAGKWGCLQVLWDWVAKLGWLMCWLQSCPVLGEVVVVAAVGCMVLARPEKSMGRSGK